MKARPPPDTTAYRTTTRITIQLELGPELIVVDPDRIFMSRRHSADVAHLVILQRAKHIAG